MFLLNTTVSTEEALLQSLDARSLKAINNNVENIL